MIIYKNKVFVIITLLTASTLFSACGCITIISSSESKPSQSEISTWSSASDSIDATDPVSGNENTIITFSDPAIENSVRSLLLREKGDIRSSDLAEIESIFIGGAESLDDLKNFPALKILDFENNSEYDPKFNTFKDISTLSDLVQLEYLNLNGNSQIIDFSPIAELVNLKRLDLLSCGIKDISFLAELQNIRELSLSNNEIENLEVLCALPGIEKLDLAESNFSDVSVLGDLTNLRELWISDNKIDNIDFIRRLTFLQKLSISRNEISDIRCLEDLNNLDTLFADENMITDLSSLTDLKKLENLSLRGNNITDLNPIKNMNQLVVLYLDGNPITDYNPVKGYYDSLFDKDFKID